MASKTIKTKTDVISTPSSLLMNLHDPGMSCYLKTGLAGLYMSLEYFQESGIQLKGGSWTLTNDSVELVWEDGPLFFKGLYENSFGVDSSGLVDLAAYRSANLGDYDKYRLTLSLQNSFLQHPQARSTEKNETRQTFSIDDNIISYSIKRYTSFNHNTFHEELFDKKGNLKNEISMKGWALPGGGVRHFAFSNTGIDLSPALAICASFAISGALYFKITNFRADGAFDKFKNYAVVFPEISDLSDFSLRKRYMEKSFSKRFVASSLGDAGLKTMILLKASQQSIKLNFKTCDVITLGSLPWASQQKTRSACIRMEELDPNIIDYYETLVSLLPDRTKKKEGKKGDIEFYIFPSVVRGLFAENLALGRLWYKDFNKFTKSKDLTKKILFEKGGMFMMLNSADFISQDDLHFIDAIHKAVSQRYAALAQRSSSRGETINFEREFEKMRSSFVRVKNQASMRKELADFFSRSGQNKILKQYWTDLMNHLNANDWQKTRDLALFAIVSFSGGNPNLAGAFRSKRDPSPEDDELNTSAVGRKFKPFSFWINTETQKVFCCSSSVKSKAKWTETGTLEKEEINTIEIDELTQEIDE